MERVLREKGSRDEIEFYCHMLCNFEMQLYAYHEDAAIVGETYKDNDVVLISQTDKSVPTMIEHIARLGG